MKPISSLAPGNAVIDARGHKCPVPTLKLRRHMAEQSSAVVVTLLADDPMAQIDVPHFCNQNRYILLSSEAVHGAWRFEIRRET